MMSFSAIFATLMQLEAWMDVLKDLRYRGS
jgi:hypothetical protein